MPDVVALGELLIDFVPAPGSTPDSPLLRPLPGGAPGNFAAAAHAYGLSAAFLGKVGTDSFGDLLLNTLSAAGIDTRGVVRDESVFTTLAFVSLTPEGDRSFSFARKPGADTMLTPEECDFSLIDSAKLFHFGTLSLTHEPARSATEAAIARARAGGKWVSCDPNLRLPLWSSPEAAREQMLWAVSRADLVKMSDEEVEFLWGCGVEEGARKLLEECGVRLALITMSSSGCYFATADERGYVPAPAVIPVDTTGAGDIFFGSFISGFLPLGKAPEALSAEELRTLTSFASCAASLSTQRSGAIPSIPPREEVLAAMATL